MESDPQRMVHGHPSIPGYITLLNSDFLNQSLKLCYSLRPIILFADIDVSRHILLAKSNMGLEGVFILFFIVYKCVYSLRYTVAYSPVVSQVSKYLVIQP
jgi:hypothetical protein